MPKTSTPKASDKTAALAKSASIEAKAEAVQAQTTEQKGEKDKFEVKPAFHCRMRAIGQKVLTTMADVQPKAVALWEVFTKRMTEPKVLYPGSFGVSVMLSEKPEDAFEYWAVVPATPDSEVPEGMEVLIVEPCDYVEVTTTLDKMQEVFAFMFGEWAQKNPEQKLSTTLPNLEWYPPNHSDTQELTICFPLEKKKE
ncbi:hypothetical protein BLNAU_21435 [Blattamonas nauphoetae]|uniref:AraC effector-binding domain-containing protein n=1 Tax=Blattamonas nauphoetae TaxID=2049346 RepID=A0ABQ9X038_9EUKA|nr:hypothetical protein BLNAU_21435 [Blattamonas nauphoetae]